MNNMQKMGSKEQDGKNGQKGHKNQEIDPQQLQQMMGALTQGMNDKNGKKQDKNRKFGSKFKKCRISLCFRGY